MAAVSNVRLKLLIDTNGRKVLFAEAGKDFVDFLFYVLSLPVGTVVKLLREKSMVGCLSNLHWSIEYINETYFQQNQSKTSVLNPLSPFNVTEIPPCFLTRKCYTCNTYNHGHYCTVDVPLTCPNCQVKMTKEWPYVSLTAANMGTVTDGCGGFVKGVVTYMIMDNLRFPLCPVFLLLLCSTNFGLNEVYKSFYHLLI